MDNMSLCTVLIVDDEPDIRAMVATALELSDIAVLQAGDAQEGYAMVVDEKPDLLLLDWMMPGTSGIELARRLKSDDRTDEIPIIMLTAKAEEDNKIQGLDAGADDYVTKPFSPRELVARVKAILRRHKKLAGTDKMHVAWKLKLDPTSHRITIGEQDLEMSPTEYRLLHFFITHPDRVYSREQLLDQVWGSNVYVDERTVDVHIRRLRKVLTVNEHEKLIQTVRGAGYRFSTKTK